MAGQKAVFLDRDGTINVEKNYLHLIEEFEFIPGVPEAIARLNRAGFLVLVVTNQSGVARGYFSLEDVERLHAHIQAVLPQFGAHIDRFYICPHHPTAGTGEFKLACNCRKGEPGLLLQASEELGVDLSVSYMVGDKLADLEAGSRAGCRSILVRTGYGEETESTGFKEAEVVDDLSAAVKLILDDNSWECQSC